MFLASLWLTACTGTTPTFDGTKMSDFFPQDGDRQAEYINEDSTNIAWKLVVEKIEPVEMIDEVEVVTWEWSRSDTGEVIGSVKWSSNSQDSIRIHGYEVTATGESVMFTTPIAIAPDDDDMLSGESVTTTTDGWTVTSTLVGKEDCSVNWGMDWEDCVHIRLDDGDGDDMVGLPFAGDYHLVQRYGPAWMHLTGYAEKWNLADYDWSGAE